MYTGGGADSHLQITSGRRQKTFCFQTRRNLLCHRQSSHLAYFDIYAVAGLFTDYHACRMEIRDRLICHNRGFQAFTQHSHALDIPPFDRLLYAFQAEFFQSSEDTERCTVIISLIRIQAQRETVSQLIADALYQTIIHFR